MIDAYNVRRCHAVAGELTWLATVPRDRGVNNMGSRILPEPLAAYPLLATTAVAAPGVGVVAGCYERYLTFMRERVRLSLGGGRFVDDQFAQVAVARASSEIDAAILQMDRNVRELWELAEAGEELGHLLRRLRDGQEVA